MGTEKEEDEEETTTSKPEDEEDSPEGRDDQEDTTTTSTPEADHEFSCKEVDASLMETTEDQLPMECTLLNGEERKTVFIVIPRTGLDTERLFSKNVKVVVKDLMIMDFSPK